MVGLNVWILRHQPTCDLVVQEDKGLILSFCPQPLCVLVMSWLVLYMPVMCQLGYPALAVVRRSQNQVFMVQIGSVSTVDALTNAFADT